MKVHVTVKSQGKTLGAEGFVSSPCRACLTLLTTWAAVAAAWAAFGRHRTSAKESEF